MDTTQAGTGETRLEIGTPRFSVRIRGGGLDWVKEHTLIGQIGDLGTVASVTLKKPTSKTHVIRVTPRSAALVLTAMDEVERVLARFVQDNPGVAVVVHEQGH